MSFNYEKHKQNGDHGSVWTSYSDLFLGLSIIFLLLYVTVSLRQGTDGIQAHFENQKLAKQNEDLKQQLKVYETLKQDYLDNSASAQDRDSYEELMSQLTLLQDKANEEKQDLRKQALENEKKEVALNKYQQMVRNIINTNLVAKGRIKTRDTMIKTKDQEIETNQVEIKNLAQTVAEKKAMLALGEQKIEGLNQSLEKRLKQLRSSYKLQKMSQKNFEKQKKEMENETQRQVAALRAKNSDVASQLNAANAQLGETNSKLQQTEQQLGTAHGKLASAEQNIGKLKGDLEAQGENLKATKGELAKAQANLNARKQLAAQIKRNFAAAGLKADVDEGTGDVLLSFGDQYFDTGKSALKPEMLNIIKQTIPTYSKSLFQDPKVAKKIQNVEIVGFASPTYQGRYIDPQSLDPNDRKAVDYNLDLSYARAKSIFNVVFDKNKMSFTHQKELLPLVKVTGRSFFSNPTDQRTPAGERKTFCDKNDCAKLQRVIIKFNLKD